MAWNSGSRMVSVSSVELMTDHHWRVVEERVPEPHPRISGIEALEIDVGVGRMVEPTIPYYLEEPLRGDMYSWPEAATGYLGLPRRQPPLSVQFRIRVEDVEVEIDREVVYLERDQAVGEVRSPIRVVPAVEVELQPGLILWPLNDSSPRKLEVTLRSNSDEPLHGSLEFQTDGPWSGLESRDFRLSATASSKAVTATLGRSSEIESGLSAVRVAARLESGEEYEFSYPLVSYPHIRSRPIPRRASTEIRTLDLRLPDLGQIGYIRGASDRVPEVLEEIGLQVELLTSDLLESGELSRFGAIVVGSRAYEVDAALRRAHSRLLDYVRGGGLLLVQYQQYQFIEGGFAPFPMEIARPHGRVTDEESPVEILEPDHPALNHPNRLTEEDWQNWVQERGLYFASSWDPKFLPILSLRDSDQPEQRGSLLIAEVDRGIYIYTGLSFFRELPAGVPGAIRLFSNLLALGES